MLSFFLIIIFCILIGKNCTQISGDYKIDIFDENVTYCSGKNIDKRLLWIRFQSLIIPTQSYWLKIKRKKLNDYPVLVKSLKKESLNLPTAQQSANCHFVAISHLVTHPSTDEQRQEYIPLANGEENLHDVIEYLLPISLCDGISGIVSLPDEKHLVKIESSSGTNLTSAILTKIPKLSMDHMAQMKEYGQLKETVREVVRRWDKSPPSKRSFHMPVHNMPGPYLVELYMIVDSKMAKMYYQHNYQRLIHRVKEIMNQINVAFMQFNVYFTVVQLEIWEHDQVKLNDDHHLLSELKLYKRRYVFKRHDCLHAILGESVGTARRGESEPASMCAFDRCVGYTKDYIDLSVMKIAHAIMHELGHNFGLSHDTERCQCVGCIMATGVEFGSLKFRWSNCSRNQIKSLLSTGMADCLSDGEDSNVGRFLTLVLSQNKAVRTLGEERITQCGNGVVDDNEQCDCGGRAQCIASKNYCCNPDTCRLNSGAYCAGGACCDVPSCSLKSSGTVCRSDHNRDCDLPEYCNGQSEWCPPDVYKDDGIKCSTGISRDSSHCHRGECQSRRSWCRVLYGDTGEEAPSVCYDKNNDGGPVKNCGVDISTIEERLYPIKYWPIRTCMKDHSICGRLWCSHDNERVLRPSPQITINEMVQDVQCSAVKFDFDGFTEEAGMVPNGSPCGYGKMCWRGICIRNVYKNMGGCYCHGHGVCNNRCHCHCDPGFAPPNCTALGDGGSIDSGPLVPFHRVSKAIIAASLVTVVVLVTIIIIATLIYHYNTHRWSPLFANLKWPSYKKSETIIEAKEPHKPLNNYLRFNRSTMFNLNLNKEVKYHTNETNESPLCSPTIPPPLLPNEKIYANSIHPTVIDGSPPLKKNPVKPSSVKAKASLFEQMPRTISTQFQNPLLNKPRPVFGAATSAHGGRVRPPILTKKPHIATHLSDTKSQLKPSIDAKINEKPSEVRIKPTVARKPKVTVISHSTEKPSLLSSKPARPKMPEKSGVDLKMNADCVRIGGDRLDDNDKTQQATILAQTKTTRKTTKDQISQPRLNQTTCTAPTCDLPATDKTLSRTVAPHKLVKIDAAKAVKYL